MTDVHGPLLTKMADIHGLPLTRMATKLCFFLSPTAKMATSHVFMLSLRIFTVLLGYTRLSSRWHSHRLFCTLRPPPASTFALARYCCWQIAVDRGSSHAQCSVLFHCSALLLSTRDAHMLPYRVWDRHREANGSFCHCDCHSVLLMLHKDRREVT